MGSYLNESDFHQLEIPAYQQLYLNGGPFPTAEGQVTIQAGSALGGGTVINWTNCLRTHPRGCASSGRGTGSRAWTVRTTTATWTRCWSGWAPPTRAAT